MTDVGRPLAEKNTRHFMREWRKQRALTQDALAERLSLLLDDDVGRDRISKLERGVDRLTERMIYALADALQIEAGWLFVRPDIILQERETLKALEGASAQEISAMLAALRALKAS